LAEFIKLTVKIFQKDYAVPGFEKLYPVGKTTVINLFEAAPFVISIVS
jgi:hypothetical protein